MLFQLLKTTMNKDKYTHTHTHTHTETSSINARKKGVSKELGRGTEQVMVHADVAWEEMRQNEGIG